MHRMHIPDGEEIRVKIRSNSHYRVWTLSISRNAHRLILANSLSGSGILHWLLGKIVAVYGVPFVALWQGDTLD